MTTSTGSGAKRRGHAADPRGLIHESFNMEGLSEQDCRTIFLDWALGVPDGSDVRSLISELAAHYGPLNPGHPMIAVLEEGLAGAGRERTGPPRRTKRRETAARAGRPGQDG